MKIKTKKQALIELNVLGYYTEAQLRQMPVKYFTDEAQKNIAIDYRFKDFEERMCKQKTLFPPFECTPTWEKFPVKTH